MTAENKSKLPSKPRALKGKLTEQQSLWHVFKLRRLLGSNNFNIIALVGILFLLAVVLCNEFFFGEAKVNDTFGLLKDVVKTCFSYSVAIVGILVAGLAILVSSDNDNLFLILASKEREKSKEITEFQFIFFNFLVAIILHLVLLTLAISGLILTESGHFLIESIQEKMQISNGQAYLVNSAFVLLFCGLLIRCILMLKSFIWNLYQSVILAILWQDHRSQEVFEESVIAKQHQSGILKAINNVTEAIEQNKTES